MSNNTQTTAGWIVFVSAVGLMCGMVSIDVAALKNWSDMQTPLFIGTTVGHIGAVIAAFVGGKIIPPARDDGAQTRRTDTPPPAA